MGGKEEEDEAKIRTLQGKMDMRAYLRKSPKSGVQVYLRPIGLPKI